MYKEQLFQTLFAYKNNIYKCTQTSSSALLKSKGGAILSFTTIFNIQRLAVYLVATSNCSLNVVKYWFSKKLLIHCWGLLFHHAARQAAVTGTRVICHLPRDTQTAAPTHSCLILACLCNSGRHTDKRRTQPLHTWWTHTGAPRWCPSLQGDTPTPPPPQPRAAHIGSDGKEEQEHRWKELKPQASWIIQLYGILFYALQQLVYCCFFF